MMLLTYGTPVWTKFWVQNIKGCRD